MKMKNFFHENKTFITSLKVMTTIGFAILSTPAIAGAGRITEAMTKQAPCGTYTAKEGDTLSLIALRQFGSFQYTNLIFRLNSAALPNADKVTPGMILVMPCIQKTTAENPQPTIINPVIAKPETTKTPIIKDKAAPCGIYITRKGDTLSSIAMREFGSYQHVKMLYLLNVPALPNKNKIEPGISLIRPCIPETQPTKAPCGTYTTRKGDTLSKIARRKFGSFQQTNALFQLNSDKLPNKNVLEPGMTLVLPCVATAKPEKPAVQTPHPFVTPTPRKQPVLTAQTSPCGTYVTRKGDSLSSIALRQFGSFRHTNAIYHLNATALPNRNTIEPGMTLHLPCIAKTKSETIKVKTIPHSENPIITKPTRTEIKAEPKPEKWKADPGDTLVSVLTDWGTKAGYDVLVEQNENWRFGVSYTHNGDFREAVEEVIAGFATAAIPPVIVFYTNDVMTIGTR